MDVIKEAFEQCIREIDAAIEKIRKEHYSIDELREADVLLTRLLNEKRGTASEYPLINAKLRLADIIRNQ